MPTGTSVIDNNGVSVALRAIQGGLRLSRAVNETCTVYEVG